ncbi:MAG: hypothetical protein J2P17_28610 [Mycobacterium sp.]|nr:hypothetical protein [Mycobacterium sp.]
MGEEEPVTPVVPPHAAGNLRRASIVATLLGAVMLAVLSVLGHPLAGVFVMIGLAAGGLNTLAVQRAVARFATGQMGGKKVFIGGVFMRLGVLTLFALAIAFFVRPDGLGVVGGMASFQLVMVGTASVPVFKELRKA